MIDIDALQRHMQDNKVPADEQAATLAEAQRRNAAEAGVHPQAEMPASQHGAPGYLAGPPSIQRALQSLPGPVRGFIAPTRPPPGTVTGVGAGIGQALGGGAAAALMPATGGLSAVGIPATAATGAMLGHTAESVLVRGTLPSWKELAWEGGTSLAPEIVESGARAGGRAMIRQMAKMNVPGKIARHEEQYRRAVSAAMGIFDAPTKETVDALFDQVRATGAQIRTDTLKDALTLKYSPIERKRLLDEMGKADAEINRRLGQPGTKTFRDIYSEVLESMKPPASPRRQAGFLSTLDSQVPSPTPAPSLTIGDAQDLRSAIRVLSEKAGDGPRKDMLQLFKGDVDDMILASLAQGGDATTGPLLAEARRQFHRFAAAEDYSEFITKHSTGLHAKEQSRIQLNFNGIMEDLRKNTSKAAQNLNRHLDAIPGARQNLDIAARDWSNLQLFFEPTEGVGAGSVLPFQRMVSRMLGEVLMSEEAVNEVTARALQHGGQITPNIIAQAVSVVRRQQAPTEQAAEKHVPDLPPEVETQMREFLQKLMQGNVPTAESPTTR